MWQEEKTINKALPYSFNPVWANTDCSIPVSVTLKSNSQQPAEESQICYKYMGCLLPQQVDNAAATVLTVRIICTMIQNIKTNVLINPAVGNFTSQTPFCFSQSQSYRQTKQSASLDSGSGILSDNTAKLTRPIGAFNVRQYGILPVGL
jgi:hypothetical protein